MLIKAQPNRAALVALAVAIVATLLGPATVLADPNPAIAIEAQVVGSAVVVRGRSPYALFVQATQWPGPSQRYVLTLGNFSPWALQAVSIVDRFFPGTPKQLEIDHTWSPGRLDPGQVAAHVIEMPTISSAGCHQLEISIADGVFSILMDCAGQTSASGTLLGSTTLWSVPLNAEVKARSREAIIAPAAPVSLRDEPKGASKLGIHVTSNNTPTIMNYVRRAQPAVVVSVGGFGWLQDVKAASPHTVTFGRFLEGDQTMSGDPVERAREFVGAKANRYLVNKGVDYWLGWNEPVIHGVEQMKWYAAFESERAEAMAELGLKAAIGNFSTGTPEADEFEAFLPAVAAAKKYGSILAVHEYSAPTLRDGVGAGIPGLDAHEDRGALTLRYRFWYDNFLQPRNLVIPLVVTEAGIDGGVLRTASAGLTGWRGIARGSGSETIAAEGDGISEYLRQLSWYDDELRRDPYVIGFAVFNVGDNGGKWNSFDVTDALPQIADLAAGKR